MENGVSGEPSAFRFCGRFRRRMVSWTFFIVGGQVRYLPEFPSSPGDIRSQLLWYDISNYPLDRTTATTIHRSTSVHVFLRKCTPPSWDIPYPFLFLQSCHLHILDFPMPLSILTEALVLVLVVSSISTVATCSRQHLRGKGRRVICCDYTSQVTLPSRSVIITLIFLAKKNTLFMSVAYPQMKSEDISRNRCHCIILLGMNFLRLKQDRLKSLRYRYPLRCCY